MSRSLARSAAVVPHGVTHHSDCVRCEGGSCGECTARVETGSEGAGSPPGLLPGVSPPPLRLPAPDEVKPSASTTKGRSDAGRSPQIVQVSGTESTKLEPAQVVPAKKRLAVSALWSKKP